MIEGPDRLLPADSLTTSQQDGAVKLRMGSEAPANEAPKSLVTVINEVCAKAKNLVAYKYKDEAQNNRLVSVTYEEYFKNIKAAAKAFIKLGLEPNRTVAVYGFNSPQWFISEMGAIYSGGMVAGLYPTNSTEVNKYILGDCKANIVVCEDAEKAKKIWDIRDELPNLKKIVVWSGEAPNLEDVISWTELMKIGTGVQDDSLIRERHKNMAINQCAILVYTSGTTGNPKGVMLSHDNIHWTVGGTGRLLGFEWGKEVMISYLPLSHIAANAVDVWAMFINGGTVFFADKMALKGTLLATIQEARPTVFFGVPRVWEKIHEGMAAKGREVKGLKKAISTACKAAGLKHHLEGKDGMMYSVGKKAVYGKVREALGLERARLFFTGAAPTAMDTYKYFLSLDIVLQDAYGMSETSGPHHLLHPPTAAHLGSVGQAVPGCKTKLKNQDPDGNGEVAMYGRNIMMGYLNREDKTSEDIDSEGYMCSGDIGSMNKDGYLFITGRIKELLITAGGENVAPVIAEDKIKAELPCISNAVLIGDKKKYLSVFLTLKTVVQNDMPTDKLAPEAVLWCQSVGSNATKVSDILSGPDGKVMSAIQAGIDRANKQAISRAACVQKWTILPLDVSIPGGELGPTLKLKRFFFNNKYSEAIERLYD